MGRTERRVRIDLILDDEPFEPAFGAPITLAPPAASPHSAHRRWLALPALVAVVASVAVWASATSSSRSAAPATTGLAATPSASPTIAPTRALPPPSNVATSSRLLTDVAGFTPTVASEAHPAIDDGSVDALWSSQPEATPGSRWFLMTTQPTLGGAPDTGASSPPSAAPAGSIKVDYFSDDGFVVRGPIAGGSATIESSGIAVDDVERLLASVSRHDDEITFDPALVPKDLTLRGTSGGGERREPLSTVQFQGGSSTLTITTTLALTPFQHVVESFFLTASDTLTVNGALATLGGSVHRGAVRRTLVVDRGGFHVTISGDVPDSVLLAAAGALRPATDGEWELLTRRVVTSGTLVDPANAQPFETGTFADGSTWTVMLKRSGPGGRVSGLALTAREGAISVQFVSATVDPVSLSGVRGQTWSAVLALGRPAAGRLLRVELFGRTIDVPLADAGTIDGTVAAVAVFEGLGPYRASVLTADGSIVASMDG